MQCGDHARRSDSERCAAAASRIVRAIRVATELGCPVEVPVISLHQAGIRPRAIYAIRLRAETIECGERPAQRKFENRATTRLRTAAASTVDCGPIEIPVRALHQRCFR